MNKNEIEEARATLWKEFDTISDERIAFLMHTFKLIARMLIEKIEKGELVYRLLFSCWFLLQKKYNFTQPLYITSFFNEKYTKK